MIFITLIICYVTEPARPYNYILDALLAIFILSYSLRDVGTASFLWRLEGHTSMDDDNAGVPAVYAETRCGFPIFPLFPYCL